MSGFRIHSFTDEWVSSVAEFNKRLLAGGSDSVFPEASQSSSFPELPGRTLYQNHFLLSQGADVRGGYILRHQDFFLRGQELQIADYQLPLSEGIIDKRFNLLGVQLLVDALKRQPLLFALGMGGYGQPLPKMLKAMGWTVLPVPFFFKVLKVRRFLAEMPMFKGSRSRRLLARLFSYTGAGWLGVRLLQFRLPRFNPCRVEVVPKFSDSVNALWNEGKYSYTLVAKRNREILDVLYPEQDKKFHRLMVYRKDQLIGWLVVLDSTFKKSKHFGALRLGSIVDGFCKPDDAVDLIKSASDYLGSRGVDLIISNQINDKWCEGLARSGFLKGPTNFLLAVSKELSKRVGENWNQSHFNRGDGDGPINLWE